MLSEDTNPYISPSQQPGQATSSFPLRWRAIFAYMSLMMGVASFVFAIYEISIMVCGTVIAKATPTMSEMIAECCFHLAPGVIWMFAGYNYWHNRYTNGIIMSLIGGWFLFTL